MRDLPVYLYGKYLSESRIGSFMEANNIESIHDLIYRSTQDIQWFWDAVVKHLGIEFYQPYEKVMDYTGGISDTKWFVNGKINIVHNCLDRHVNNGRASHIALRFENDGGYITTVTYGELNKMVQELAWTLRESGIKKGDRLALCMPISIEAVVIMLASLKIGAISTQISCRISPQELVGNLHSTKPKILFINDGYKRGGKRYDCRPLYEAVKKDATIFEDIKIIVLERLFTGLAFEKGCGSWNYFMAKGDGRSVETLPLDSEAYAMILYSSGTTGDSKAIVHTHVGALVQAAKEINYLFDCFPDDIFFWFTNIGWMMAPWEIIGVLFSGATLVIYDGTPFYPTPQRIFEIIEKHKISIFGFVPTAMRLLASSGYNFSRHDISSVRILGSTGEVLDGKTWKWYLDTFGSGRCPIINFSGGTELLGGLVGSLPITMQTPGTVGGPGLGMDVDVVDEAGLPVRGKIGYLVCRKPFPSMTRGFWNNRDKFMKTYFSKMPGIWFHGDLAEIGEDGLWYLRGRADDLIIRGGVKHDPSKIEEALINFSDECEVLEAAVIGVPDLSVGQRIVCFIVLGSPGLVNRDEKEYLDNLRNHVGMTHDPMARPDEIYILELLPKNMAGKIPRDIIRKAFNGEPVNDLSKIEHPEMIELIRELGSVSRQKPT